MQVEKLTIPELLLVAAKKHRDQRGFFQRHFVRMFLLRVASALGSSRTTTSVLRIKTCSVGSTTRHGPERNSSLSGVRMAPSWMWPSIFGLVPLPMHRIAIETLPGMIPR